MIAALNGNFVAFEQLAFLGATIFLTGDEGRPLILTDLDGNTVLHYAAAGGNVDIVDATCNEWHDDATRYFFLNCPNNKKRTPLMIAAQYGRLKALQRLVGRGANIFVIDQDDSTLLHYAAHGGITKIVDYLLAVIKVSGIIAINYPDKYGRTPVISAALSGRGPMLSYLISLGAEVQQRTSGGNTALHYALEYNHADIARRLVRAGARLFGSNNKSMTPLLLAQMYDVSRCIRDNNHKSLEERLLNLRAEYLLKKYCGGSNFSVGRQKRLFLYEQIICAAVQYGVPLDHSNNVRRIFGLIRSYDRTCRSIHSNHYPLEALLYKNRALYVRDKKFPVLKQLAYVLQGILEPRHLALVGNYIT